jgi:hypothetical protein
MLRIVKSEIEAKQLFIVVLPRVTKLKTFVITFAKKQLKSLKKENIMRNWKVFAGHKI